MVAVAKAIKNWGKVKWESASSIQGVSKRDKALAYSADCIGDGGSGGTGGWGVS